MKQPSRRKSVQPNAKEHVKRWLNGKGKTRYRLIRPRIDRQREPGSNGRRYRGERYVRSLGRRTNWKGRGAVPLSVIQQQSRVYVTWISLTCPPYSTCPAPFGQQATFSVGQQAALQRSILGVQQLESVAQMPFAREKPDKTTASGQQRNNATGSVEQLVHKPILGAVALLNN